MKHKRVLKIAALLLIWNLLFSSECLGQEINIIQSIFYKKVYVLQPDGDEKITLVNRFTDQAEYIWAINKWIKAPAHIRYCYKNQDKIKMRVSPQKRYR